MRVFVTGATGWIGSAVVPDLLAAGHQVVGLARSDRNAAKLVAAGAEARRGSLADLDVLHAAAAAADGVIHLAFDSGRAWRGGGREALTAAAELDRSAIGAMADALAGSDRPFVGTSGTMLAGLAVPAGQTAREADFVPDERASNPRMPTENLLVGLAGRGIRSSVLRLAPTVHGAGDHGFVAVLVDAARRHGFAAQIGDGHHRWPAVHVRDAARLFRLAVESAPAGSRLHGAAEDGVPFAEIAGAIAERLDLPVRRIAADEAVGHFGFVGAFVGMDNPVSTAETRRLTGWTPAGPTLLDDLAAGHYTAAGA